MQDILSDFYSGNYKWDCNYKLIKRLYKRVRKDLASHYKTGDVTEYLTRYNLNKYLQNDMSLKRIRSGKEPNSYMIRYHWGKKKGSHRKGVDVWLRYFDRNCNPIDYLIEIMGWKRLRFGISDYLYNKRIANRFKRYDPNNKRIHVAIITRHNIPLIAERCKRDNIKIVSIPIHPTPSYLKFILTQQERKHDLHKKIIQFQEKSYGENT